MTSGPIILVCDGDVVVYEDVEDASTSVEPIDVENGEYEGGWDAVGRPVRLRLTQSPDATHRGMVSVEILVDATPAEAELRQRLSEWLRAVGSPIEPTVDSPLGLLVAVALAGQRVGWKSGKWARLVSSEGLAGA